MDTAQKYGMTGVTGQAQDLWAKVSVGVDIEDTDWQALIDQINERLKELQLDPIKLNFDTGQIDKMSKDSKGMSREWQAAGQAIQGVGQAMSAIEDPAAKVVGTIAQAIASVALAASQAMAAKDTTASGWAWIGAAAAITGTMISTIAAIHSATGYANGGEIKGTTYSGDAIGGLVDGTQLVGLNAGEVVLTRAMQGNLASQLQGGGIGNLNLTATIRGEQIRLALNNNSRRTGRGEYVTTNFR